MRRADRLFQLILLLRGRKKTTARWLADALLGLDEIYQAISHQNQMQINYVRRDGQTSDRLVCPLGLTFWGTSWTLTAWCELRQDFRNFRLDRIQVFKILPIPFTLQKGQTFHDYLALVGGHAPSTAQSTQEVRPVK